jgi:hypothetical protein
MEYDFHQGLKPELVVALSGTTEVVPFHDAAHGLR